MIRFCRGFSALRRSSPRSLLITRNMSTSSNAENISSAFSDPVTTSISEFTDLVITKSSVGGADPNSIASCYDLWTIIKPTQWLFPTTDLLIGLGCDVIPSVLAPCILLRVVFTIVKNVVDTKAHRENILNEYFETVENRRQLNRQVQSVAAQRLGYPDPMRVKSKSQDIQLNMMDKVFRDLGMDPVKRREDEMLLTQMEKQMNAMKAMVKTMIAAIPIMLVFRNIRNLCSSELGIFQVPFLFTENLMVHHDTYAFGLATTATMITAMYLKNYFMNREMAVDQRSSIKTSQVFLIGSLSFLASWGIPSLFGFPAWLQYAFLGATMGNQVIDVALNHPAICRKLNWKRKYDQMKEIDKAFSNHPGIAEIIRNTKTLERVKKLNEDQIKQWEPKKELTRVDKLMEPFRNNIFANWYSKYKDAGGMSGLKDMASANKLPIYLGDTSKDREKMKMLEETRSRTWNNYLRDDATSAKLYLAEMDRKNREKSGAQVDKFAGDAVPPSFLDESEHNHDIIRDHKKRADWEIYRDRMIKERSLKAEPEVNVPWHRSRETMEWRNKLYGNPNR